jgi:glutathione synthase/RimK-type ligase-like ATP-grasp enzyme
MKSNPDKFFIIKPTNKSQGRGITLSKKYKEVVAEMKNHTSLIAEQYIDNPLLIDG